MNFGTSFVPQCPRPTR